MKLSSRLFPALVSMIVSSGCVEQFPPPVSPPYPFEIKGYSIFIDEQPGDYDVITIGDRTYCYFTKKMDDEDDLFIEDKGCDLHSDRVVLFSRYNIILRYDTQTLPQETRSYLDYILQNHKKHIFKDDAIVF
ncbi:MAG: hypothetical protein Q8R47_01735 [Nanoarchaeota archaeon]|nr:hypothetical protein [Nanoarchaeota archaeon]